MFRGDASSELLRLERGLADARERFLHAPGGLWLAASATLEAVSRIDPALLDDALRARAARLADEARRMRSEGDSRASQHELAALAEWVELARHRAALEETFLATSENAPSRFTSRAELAAAVEADERVLEGLAREGATQLAPSTEALVSRLRAAYPEYDPLVLPAELVEARGRAALRELGRHRRGEQLAWRVRAFPSSETLVAAAALSLAVAIGALLYFDGLARMAAILSVGLALITTATLLFAAISRRRAEMNRRVTILEAWGYRAQRERALEAARRRHERWVGIARALGQIDAFRRTEAGVALEAREHRLPALAPWVRTLVGGFDEAQAQRFEAS
ncbi:MAG: hypothetical protein OHK0013_42490 [Sandaracinaceae bacterium]